MATLPIVSRARVILDLVKDGEVSRLGDYAGVEMVSGATALIYAQSFWDAYPGRRPELFEADGVTPRTLPTNNELAIFYIDRIRDYHKEIRKASRVVPAARTAREAEAVLADTDNTTDLGANESA